MVEVELLTGLERVVILDLGRDQRDLVGVQRLDLFGQLVAGERLHVELDEVGDLEQRQAVVADHEVVEGDQVAEVDQPPQLLQHVGIERLAAVQLEHHTTGREQRHEVMHHEVAGGVDKGAAAPDPSRS